MQVYKRVPLPTIPSVGQPESPWPRTASQCLAGEILPGHRKVWSCFICDFSFVIARKRWTRYNSSLLNVVVSFMCRPVLHEHWKKAGLEKRRGHFCQPRSPMRVYPLLWSCRATACALHTLGLVGPTSWFNPLAWQKNLTLQWKSVEQSCFRFWKDLMSFAGRRRDVDCAGRSGEIKRGNLPLLLGKC